MKLGLVCCRRHRRWSQACPPMLAKNDTMMEYLEHTGSALFAVPPGVRPGGYWAESLLG